MTNEAGPGCVGEEFEDLVNDLYGGEEGEQDAEDDSDSDDYDDEDQE